MAIQTKLYAICVDGIDGIGKTKFAKSLTSEFSLRGFRTKYVHFPDLNAGWGGEICKRASITFNDLLDADQYELAGIFTNNRHSAYAKALDYYKSGNAADNYDVVVFDRCWLSTLVYQSTIIRYRQFLKDHWEEFESSVCDRNKIFSRVMSDDMVDKFQLPQFVKMLVDHEIARTFLSDPEVFVQYMICLPANGLSIEMFEAIRQRILNRGEQLQTYEKSLLYQCLCGTTYANIWQLFSDKPIECRIPATPVPIDELPVSSIDQAVTEYYDSLAREYCDILMSAALPYQTKITANSR